jgi:hypothetical protein
LDGNFSNASSAVVESTQTGANDSYVGGIVGRANGQLGISPTTTFTNAGVVRGASYVGGLFGEFGSRSTIYLSNKPTLGVNTLTMTNSRFVEATGNYVGNLIGRMDAPNTTIPGGVNNNDLSGAQYVGGFVGQVLSGRLVGNFSNTKYIKGTDNVGGIV